MSTPEQRPTGQPSVDEQRVELEELREELGDTVEELARRADVPARVKARRDELVTQAKEMGEQAKVTVAEKAPVVRDRVQENQKAIAAAVGALVLLLIVRARRRRSRRTSA